MEKNCITVVKVGGAVVEDSSRLSELLDNFCKIEGRKAARTRWRKKCHQDSRRPRNR